jgi:hypothetical protein
MIVRPRFTPVRPHTSAAALVALVLAGPTLAQPCLPEFSGGFELPGVNGTINASVLYDAQDGLGPRLYVGGSFSRAGGKLCNGVAVWTGSEFAPLGGGVPANNLATSGSGTVRALAVLDPDGSGPLKPELWVGGSFTRAQQPNGTRITVNGLARWNGSTQTWSNVPRSFGENNVFAFFVDEQSAGPDPVNNPFPNAGPRIYVSTNSATSPTAYLMAYRFNGSSYSRIDFFATDAQPIENQITCFAKFNGQVYFGGAFDKGVRRISEDGTAHEPLPSDPLMASTNTPITMGAATVGSMLEYQGRLLISPQYTAPAGSAINMFPCESFDGTSWQPETFGPLGSTIYSGIGTMKLIDIGTGPKLYFGGSANRPFNTAEFETPAGLPPEFNGGAVWDGTTLSPLGGGLSTAFLSIGNALTFTPLTVRGEPVVFTGGVFEYASNTGGQRVQGRAGAFWTGSAWKPQYAQPVNGGFSGNAVVKLDGVTPVVISNGSFNAPLPFTVNANGIAQYDGTGWSGSTIRSASDAGAVAGPTYLRYDDGTGEALFAFGNNVAAATPTTNVAKYNATTQTWTSVSNGAAFPGSIATGTPEGNNFVGTVFDTDGPGPERPWLIIAGNASPFDPGFPAGNTPNIYAYTGTQWVVLGSGLPDTGNQGTAFGTDSRVTALAIHDDGTGPKLYASGTFTGANSGAVARYDGTGATGTWTIIGKTTVAFENFTKIRSVDVGTGPALHAFGMFSDIYAVLPNGTPTGPVARWDGTEWVGLDAGTLARTGTGGPITPFVADIAAFDDTTGPALYAIGPFGAIGGVNARGFARFDGGSWSGVGVGFNSFTDNLRMEPKAMVVFDDDGSGPIRPAIYISGFFDNADGTHSHDFARYGVPCPDVSPRCNPADIANDDGSPLPPIGVAGTNNGVTEGDYNLFFANFFDALPVCDIANDDGSPLPPFGTLTTNNGVTEADYNLFFAIYFDGCAF